MAAVWQYFILEEEKSVSPRLLQSAITRGHAGSRYKLRLGPELITALLVAITKANHFGRCGRPID